MEDVPYGGARHDLQFWVNELAGSRALAVLAKGDRAPDNERAAFEALAAKVPAGPLLGARIGLET
jgi:hypothetical protein